TGVLRSKLQRAIMRVADCLIEVASGAGSRREHFEELAILSCRKVAGFLQLLKAGGVLSEQQHNECGSLVTKSLQLLMQRLKEWRLTPQVRGPLDVGSGNRNGRDISPSGGTSGVHLGILSTMKKPPSSS